ncbi:MAG TPA: vanadium-dependent haloperoxidase [Gemmatimonadaceae bacterium]
MSLAARSTPPHPRALLPCTSLRFERALRSMQLVFVAAIAALSACTDRPTDPASSQLRAPSSVSSERSFPAGLASVGWQEQARSLVAAHPATMSPINAVRAYALLSVAQYGAVVDAGNQLDADEALQSNGFGAGGRSRFEAERGAIAGASAQVLSYLFPDAAAVLEERLANEGTAGPGGVHPQFTRGVAIGRAFGEVMKTWAASDGFSTPACLAAPRSATCIPGAILTGSGFWTRNPAPPGGTLPPIAGPQFGAMKPYFLTSGAQFHPAPPPTFGSPDYLAGLNETITKSSGRTPAQLADARAWNLPQGTMTPLGYWDRLAAQYIAEHGLDERAAAHVFALTNAAAMDAVIGCWEAKFSYYFIRPWQASPAVALDPVVNGVGIGLPNHPSYPSGHSCVSASAGTVIETFFPEHATVVDQQVAAAGESRIIAGIHFPFDIRAGQALGRSVAALAIAYDRERGLLAAVR